METGLQLIIAERHRQIKEEHWTSEHDDEHADFSLTRAAICYADAAGNSTKSDLRPTWPWDAVWFKPSADPVRNLVKAGALIAAEIDRLLRS